MEAGLRWKWRPDWELNGAVLVTTPSERVDGWKGEVGGNVRGRDVREHGSGRTFRRLLRKMV